MLGIPDIISQKEFQLMRKGMVGEGVGGRGEEGEQNQKQLYKSNSWSFTYPLMRFIL